MPPRPVVRIDDPGVGAVTDGRAAEEVFTGNVTSGAADDFRKATNIARKMVLEWGMGDNFKNMALSTDSGPVFLGEDMGKPKMFSEHTSQLVDEDAAHEAAP